jgi:hypothetical protein
MTVKLGFMMGRDRRLRYDWLVVQRFFDAGHGFAACQRAFGFS